MRPLLIALMLAASASAQTVDTFFHVTAVRSWTETDAPRVTRSFRTYVVTGTMDNEKVTGQQIFSYGSQRIQVGKDYKVSKADDKALELIVLDKKGRPSKERLDITGVEEVTK